MRYHINDKGEVNRCKAQKGNCPITKETGGEHYNTVNQAQAAYEKSQTPQSVKSLASVVDPKKFKKFIDEGYISERKHPEDDSLRVYSYTPKTQFSGMWSPETLLARGLILKTDNDGNLDTAEIHARALGKFFTVEQMSEGDWTNVKLVDDDENVTIQENAPIDFDSPATVADKMNGALGVTYIAPDGTAQISTKGSFTSIEAGIGSKVLNKYDEKKLGKFLNTHMKNSTPLFEIISPDRPHPVDYGDMEDVVLLGTVNKTTGKWTPIDENHKLVQEFGFQIPEKIPATTLREALAIPYKQNTEGMVVTTTDPDGKQKMYKVKPEEYHKLRSAFYRIKKGKVSETAKYMKNTDMMSIKNSDDVQVELEHTAKQWEPTVKKDIYEKYVKPTQDTVKNANSKLDNFLKENKMNVDDKQLRKFIAQSGEKDKQLLFTAIDDRTKTPGILMKKVQEQVLKQLS